MKLATLRRRPDALPGVSGVARLDRRTTRLAGRLSHGDIAVIDHVDIDRVAAEALLAGKPAAIVNAQPSISGRYPNLGPEVIAASGTLLIDNVGAEVFAAIKEGTRIRIDGDSVFIGDTVVARGTAQTNDTVAAAMDDAKAGMSTQLEAFAVNTADFLASEHDLLFDGVGIPPISTRIRDRHVIVVCRGYDHERELKALKHYIREFKPVLIGVDGGADVLLAAGHKPDIILGDMDAVSETALGCGAEIVVHAYPDGRAPGLLRVQDLGIDASTFPAGGTSEDLALLLADDNGAALIVAVGVHATLTEFLDKGRTGMASSFLTRLRIGGKLVDAGGVIRLYRSRISAAALLLLVIATLIAVVAALATTDAGRTYLTDIGHHLQHGAHWVRTLFS